jgi:anti-sigma factor RsiW
MMSDANNDHLLLHALADQELDAADALALERRLATEPALAADYERIIALKQAVKSVGKPAVSEEFTGRIAALARGPSALAGEAKGRRMIWPDWRALAASIILTAFVASSATYMLIAPRGDAAIEDLIADGHRRSLLAASPIDIASSDRHTVRPWFDGKLGVSPPTPDLSAAGFPLIGGRVDVVANAPVPTLVYRHNQHLITLVAIPAKGDETEGPQPETKVVDGYNMIHWRDKGFRYWAVSDLDVAGLKTFVEAVRAR